MTDSARPILFSGEMVRAILEGRKTQTRRVIKSQPSEGWHPEVGSYAPTCVDRHGEEYPGAEVYGASDEDEGRISPYGQPGDRLWVRETWQILETVYDGYNGTTDADEWHGPVPKVQPEEGFCIDYRADDRADGPWRPSIFMPRWASRITLEIVNVSVERVQEISEADANREGCPLPAQDQAWSQCRLWYRELWDKINAKREFGWDVNPWVWVIEFKRNDSEAK